MEDNKLNKWRWGVDAFVSVGDLGHSMPAYFDVDMPSSSDIKSGIITKDAGKFISGYPGLNINGGYINYSGYNGVIWPSESIHIIFPDDTTLSLPFDISHSLMPQLVAYTRISEIVIPLKEYVYSPGSRFSNGNSAFRFKINDNNEVEVHTSPWSRSNNITLSNYKLLEDNTRAFYLSQFPITNITMSTSLSDSTIDYIRGIIYTSDSVSSITLSYDVSPLFSYLPINSNKNKVFIDAPLQTGKFAKINSSSDLYR